MAKSKRGLLAGTSRTVVPPAELPKAEAVADVRPNYAIRASQVVLGDGVMITPYGRKVSVTDAVFAITPRRDIQEKAE